MTIGPIEESFAMISRYGLQVVYSSSDAEGVDSLTYAWRLLREQVCVGVLIFLF